MQSTAPTTNFHIQSKIMAWKLHRVCFAALLLLSLTRSSEQVLGGPELTGAARPGPSPLRPSTAVPPAFSTQRTALPAIRIEPSGRVTTTQILKQQLANELGLPLRDLRIVDPSYPNQIQATFTSRKKAILFCIENIKVVVQHHEALVFSPFQPEVQEFVPALQQQIAQVHSRAHGGSQTPAPLPTISAVTPAHLTSHAPCRLLLRCVGTGGGQRRGCGQPRRRLPLRTRRHRGASHLPPPIARPYLIPI